MSLDIDAEWESFKNDPEGETNNIVSNIQSHISNINANSNVDESTTIKETPKCSELNISTQTKVLFLSSVIDIYNIFWLIPIIMYSSPTEGIIKKQIKIVSHTREEFNDMQNRLKLADYYTENIIKQIDKPTARRIKYKDERKVTIGISKKDIINSRGKKKNAFYNCFAIYIRFLHNDCFKEIHVKVFNTGKLEIPGVTDSSLLGIIKTKVLETLQPHIEENLTFVDNPDVSSDVLINSNFNCNYAINSDKLLLLLKSDKYNIETAFDPCSYPGVKCKYYYNNELDQTEQTGCIETNDKSIKIDDLIKSKKYTTVSFMIFRTGSVLIVGNCNEETLNNIYTFVSNMLEENYSTICSIGGKTASKKAKVIKIRKRKIIVTSDYHNKISK